MQLEVNPFLGNNCTKDYFFTEERNSQINTLLHLTRYSDDVLVVSGPEGIGKSCAFQRYMRLKEERMRVCDFSGEEDLGAKYIVTGIALFLGLKVEALPPEEILKVLTDSLEQRALNYLPVVVVDDAEQLGVDALEILLRLSNLKDEQGPLIRIVLFGREDLSERLKDDWFASIAPVHVMSIQAFDERECAEYMEHCIRSTGHQNGRFFTDREAQQVFQQSAGVPMLINRFAADITEKKMHGTGNMSSQLKAAYGVAALILLTGLVSFFYPSSEPQPVVNEGAVSTPMTGKKQSAQNVAAQKHKETATRGDGELSSTLPEIRQVNPSVFLEGYPPRTITLLGSGFSATDRVLLEDGKGSRELAPEQIHLQNPSALEIELGEALPAGQWSVYVINQADKISNLKTLEIKPLGLPQASTASKAKAPIQTENGALHSAEWVMQRNPSHYSIQLFASSSADRLPNYAAKHSLSAELATMSIERGGKAIHLLIMGDYATLSDARVREAELKQAGLSTWVRSFADLQANRVEVTTVQAPAPVAPKTTAQAPEHTANTSKAQTDDVTVWAWTQDPQNYTLQLGAGIERGAHEAFMRRNPAIQSARVLPLQRGSKTVYLLLYGSFQSRQEADEATTALDGMSKPWLRTFAMIQDELSRQ